jgi:hypothetical protein
MGPDPSPDVFTHVIDQLHGKQRVTAPAKPTQQLLF